MFQSNYWNLLRELTMAQLKLKDQSTFFGFVWSFLNPLLLVLVLYIFFQTRLAEGVKNFPIYLLIGVIHYNHFTYTTNSAMHVLHSMRSLTGEVVFPKELMVIGLVLASSPEFLLELGIVVFFAMFAQLPLSGAYLWLPFVALLQLMLTLWVSLGLACVYVFVRDTEHLYGVFLRLLFFMTPIFYAPTFLGDSFARWAVTINPLAQLMELTRGIILDANAPPLGLALLLVLLNGFALAAAWRLFKFLEPHFAERV